MTRENPCGGVSLRAEDRVKNVDNGAIEDALLVLSRFVTVSDRDVYGVELGVDDVVWVGPSALVDEHSCFVVPRRATGCGMAMEKKWNCEGCEICWVVVLRPRREK